MWKKFGLILSTFVAGYALGGVVDRSKDRSSKVSTEDLVKGYPVSVEWLAPATDNHPYPTRRAIEFTQALEGDKSVELASERENGAIAHSVTLRFDGGRKISLVGHEIKR